MTQRTKQADNSAIYLILGGARSGKSSAAQRLAQRLAQQQPVLYVATAQALDDEMQKRITRHQAERPSHWLTLEEPLHLAATLKQAAQRHPEFPILVDCLTLWLTNALLASQSTWEREKKALLEVLPTLPQPLILVSNEVGSGIVPLGELSRAFVDEAGWLHQELAALAKEVQLVVAGLPLTLKS